MTLKEENLRLKIALLDMALQHYEYRCDVEKAKKLGVAFDEEDEKDGYVNLVFHQFENAGEHAFKVLGIEKDAITTSKLWEIREGLVDKVLEIHYGKEPDTENVWICTKEQLPPVGVYVLAYTEYKGISTDYHTIVTKYEGEDYWFDGTITHWMPLPFPPIIKK